jgi:integrase
MSLTDAQIRSFKPSGQKVEHSCGKGLFLVVGTTGQKSFVQRYKVDGQSRRKTLGTYPEMKLSDAALEGALLKKAVKNGLVAVVVEQPKGKTVNEAFALYMKVRWGSGERHDHDKRNRARWAMFENNFEDVLGDRLLASVTKAEIKKLLRDKHNAMVARGTTGRGIINIHAFLTAFFNWCVVNDDLTGLEHSPTDKLAKLAQPGERDRWLDRWECGLVLCAIRSVGGEFAAPLELLMRAGCRKSDIFNLTDSMVITDNDELGPHLLIEDTKNGQDLVVPLVPAMFGLLPKERSGKVWPCSGDSTSNVKERIDAEVERLAGRAIPEWRLHDLRTTIGSHLDTFGTADAVIEKILCHKEPNRAKRTYRRYGFFQEKKAALQQWSDLLDTLVAKVIEPMAVAA